MALLEQSRLEAMRRQLQPQTILDALDALRHLYNVDITRADELVDELVGFLRPAVRSLVGDSATIANELDLAQRYLRLRALITTSALKPGSAHLQPPPERSFPPRLLMPIVESLSLSGARISLDGVWKGEDYKVILTCEGVSPGALSPRLRRRIADVSQQWASAFASEIIEDGDDLSWTLTIVRARRSKLLEIHP